MAIAKSYGLNWNSYTWFSPVGGGGGVGSGEVNSPKDPFWEGASPNLRICRVAPFKQIGEKGTNPSLFPWKYKYVGIEFTVMVAIYHVVYVVSLEP